MTHGCDKQIREMRIDEKYYQLNIIKKYFTN